MLAKGNCKVQWNKDTICKILEHTFPNLSVLQIQLFLLQKVKLFRLIAIYELLRRCEWCEESGGYLMSLFSDHL